MKKILIIGSGGAGKSTLAKQLGDYLQLEVVHLDAAYWKPGWVEPSHSEWDLFISQLLQKEQWIMDGNYSRTLKPRIAACDTIIFLDVSRFVCIWSVIKRWLKYRNTSRPDMAEGCKEQINWEFIQWIWNYPAHSRPKVVRLLDQYRDQKQLYWLKSREEMKAFVNQLRTSE